MKIKPERIRKTSAVCGLSSLPRLRRTCRSVVSPVRRQAAFTLIELLMVLTIIGLLMGLLFPALLGARERARISRARSEILTLQQAWLAYWNTYGEMLGWPGVIEMNAAAVEILAGVDTTANPQQIAFMEFDERHFADGFRDPWGLNNYRIELTRPGDPEDTEVAWVFETRAQLINTARYRY